MNESENNTLLQTLAIAIRRNKKSVEWRAMRRHKMTRHLNLTVYRIMGIKIQETSNNV